MYVSVFTFINADKIIEIMRMYDLYAANTHFEPKKGESPHTYLGPKPKGPCAQGDFGLHVGEQVSCRYKGRTVKGEVIAVEQGKDDSEPDEWSVLFEDGHLLKCGKRRLRKLLAQAETPQAQKQIDHILVSNRWRSSVTDCRPCWAPSIHRSITGKRSDHALLGCSWKWRMRVVKKEAVPDFSVLRSVITKQGQESPNSHAQEFQQAVTENLKAAEFDAQGSTAEVYDKLCVAINKAAEDVLPKVKRKKGVRRKVSRATRELYNSTEAKVERTKKECDELKEARRKAGLSDFKTWVNECADLLNHANGHGDTKTAHDLIKQMEGKSDKPPKNL